MSSKFLICCAFLPAAALLTSVDRQAMASPVEDSARLFGNYDRDGDGRLSADEIGAFAWGRYDADGDGAVTQAEFVAGRTSDKRRAETADAQTAWSLLDWNHDGYLSGTELDGKWEKFDGDGDGKVQKAEFVAGRGGPAVMPRGKPANDAGPDEPAAGGGESLWGRSLAAAKESDLFQFFRLQQDGDPNLIEAGSQYKFRNSGGDFSELMMMNLVVSRDDKIVAAELFLARSFVDHPRNGVFARDIAKSFLDALTPAADAAKIRDLRNEIEFGAPGTTFVGGFTPPKLPETPTEGYQAYLGKKPDSELPMSQAKLVIIAGEASDDWLLISMQSKSEE